MCELILSFILCESLFCKFNLLFHDLDAVFSLPDLVVDLSSLTLHGLLGPLEQSAHVHLLDLGPVRLHLLHLLAHLLDHHPHGLSLRLRHLLGLLAPVPCLLRPLSNHGLLETLLRHLRGTVLLNRGQVSAMLVAETLLSESDLLTLRIQTRESLLDVRRHTGMRGLKLVSQELEGALFGLEGRLEGGLVACGLLDNECVLLKEGRFLVQRG